MAVLAAIVIICFLGGLVSDDKDLGGSLFAIGFLAGLALSIGVVAG